MKTEWQKKREEEEQTKKEKADTLRRVWAKTGGYTEKPDAEEIAKKIWQEAETMKVYCNNPDCLIVQNYDGVYEGDPKYLCPECRVQYEDEDEEDKPCD